MVGVPAALRYESRRREDHVMVESRERQDATAQAAPGNGPSGQPRPSERTTSRAGNAELVTEQGKTTIANSVVAKIAGIAVREVAGVHDLSTRGAGGMISGLATRVTGGDTSSQGVAVEVGEREAAIDLGITVTYGVSIPQVADAVRRNVMTRLEAMTGLVVKEVNIDVTDLFFPEDAARQQQERRVE